MPAYPHMFVNDANIETAYAEALTIKKVFNVPYDQPDMPVLGTFEEAQQNALAEAKNIVDNMKSKEVKEAYAKGEIKQIVAIIAYLNSLK
jgi:cytochrome c oxidase cbb3-type subunit 2